MRFTVVLAILAVCLAFVRSDNSCIYFPASIPFGGICNGGVSCQYGSYCSRSSVCTVNEKVGNDCSRDKGCELGSTCKGPDFDTQICVLLAHPGQDASSDTSTTLPSCGRNSYDGERCVGGEVGDSCYLDSDCITEKCDPADLKCLPRANGESCDSTRECPLASYCDTTDDFECKARKTSGTCTATEQCATGYGCMQEEDGDMTCAQYLSLEDGAYCEGGEYCINQRCINNHCAAKKVDICSESSQCTVSQYCNCDGKLIEEGFGKCVDFPCAKLRDNFYLCKEGHCHDDTYFNGSCIYNFCKTEYETYNICNSASSLAISLLSISLVSFFVSFLSKRV